MNRRYTALFFLVMFMIGTDTFLISPLLPTLQAEFGVSTGSAGWMLGAYTLASAVFALVAGPLSDGWDRRTVLLCGLAGFAVSTCLCGFADGFWTMCLFRVLAGVSAAFTAPQVWASIPAALPAAKVPKAMGIAFAGLAASQALGVPIGSWLAAASWPVPFWTIGACSLALLAAAFVLLPPMKPAGRSAPGLLTALRRYAPLAASPKARAGFLGYLLVHLGGGTAFAFLGKWLADRFGLHVGQIGNAMICLGLGNLLGSFISPYAVRRFGAWRAVAAVMGVIVALYAILPHLSPVAVVAGLYFAVYTMFGVLFPIIMNALTSLNASVRGTVSSLANATMNGANTLGASVAGLLYAHLGGFPAIGLFAAASLALALLTFRLGGLFGGAAKPGADAAPGTKVSAS